MNIDYCGSVLLVDDEDSLRTVVGTALKRAGISVTLAKNGLEALEITREQHPDLLVSDIMMPGLDGYQLVEAIHADDSIPPPYIIFLSAKATNRDILHGFDFNVDDYLSKPFQIPELIARVRAGLRIIDAQHAQERTNQELLAALAQRDDLLNLVAHDLRNPVHVIHSYASLLGQDVIDPAQIKEICIRRSNEIMRLIDRVASITNLASRNITLHPTLVRMGMIVEKAKGLVAPLVQQRDSSITLLMQGEYAFISDHQKLTEILDSIFYAASQALSSNAEMQCSLLFENEQAHFSAIIPTDLTQKQADRILDIVIGGIGWRDGLDTSAHLGLFIARQLVELLGGTLGLQCADHILNIAMQIPAIQDEDDAQAHARLKDASPNISISEE